MSAWERAEKGDRLKQNEREREREREGEREREYLLIDKVK